MAEKIKKTYTVGGKTFDTYDEAIAHRQSLTPDEREVAISVRMPKSLSLRLRAVAAKQGLSLNDWAVRHLLNHVINFVDKNDNEV